MNTSDATSPIPFPSPATTPAVPDAELSSSTTPALTQQDASERRRHRRFNVARPGKIFRRSTQQFVPASSRDLSFGGTLLELQADRPVAVGEILDVGLAMNSKAILPEAALIRGIVVRAKMTSPTTQLVAVRYLHTNSVKQAA